MNVLQLLRDRNIPYQLDGPKTTKDFVNVHCPFCTGNKNYHLGIELNGKVAHCWRCGSHPTRKALAKMFRMPDEQIQALLQQYGGVSAVSKEVRFKIRRKEFKLPSNTMPLQSRHKRYLKARKFDSERLSKEWHVIGTGPLSLLDGIDYKHRILAPIIWDGKPVSFQTRDVTGKHRAKYMACPETRELIKHKHILYGQQSAWKDTGICVEGITDVWRLGPAAFATFGIEYTFRQIREITRAFKRIIILFDDESQAQAQAHKLKADLQFRGKEAVVETITGDPGDLDQKVAEDLTKRFFSIPFG